MKNEIISLVETEGDLPPTPEVLLKLEQRANDPECEISGISAIIETESVLSGRLIQLSNNVLFGGGREKVVDVEDSVMKTGC